MGEPASSRRAADGHGIDRHRERLWSLAYRMLGSPEDADDVVQDTFLRWHRSAPERVRDPEAWLVRVATRICIDRLRALETERKRYVGPWLPTPTMRGDAPPTDRAAEIASELSVAFLLLLERLSPEERAAFLLREAFDAPYTEVATVVGKSEDAARQMVHRARKRIRAGRPRFTATLDERERIARQFARIIATGDPEAVQALLDPDARLVTDGGGKVWAARRVITGARRVARGLAGAARKLAADAEVSSRVATVNREPCIVTYQDGELISVTALEVTEGRVLGIYRILNPEKLGDLRALTRPRPAGG